jgi:Retrotransposon gag protein
MDDQLHQAIIQAVQTAIAPLSDRIMSLEANYHGLVDQLNQTLPTSAQSQPATEPVTSIPDHAVPSARPVVPLPTKFNGNHKALRAFKEQVANTFLLSPGAYPTDASKVAFVANLLEGPPADWHASLDRHDPRRTNFAAYLESLTAMWDNPLLKQDAEHKLVRLEQGRRPAASYAAEFKLLAASLDWNEPALMSHFRRGLNPQVRIWLQSVSNGVFKTFSDLAETAARFDHYVHAGEVEARRNDRARERHVRSVHPVPARPANAGSSSGMLRSDPMMVDSAMSGSSSSNRLTADARAERRANNLCLYCGAAGHYARNCPVRPGNSSRQGQ